jgi:hypothetical protein
MNRMIVCGVALLGAAFTSAPAFAQATDNANAAGSTTIVQPLTITNTSGLAFGRIVKPTTGTGTVAIANTADSVSAGAGAVALTGITTSRAKFTINGEGAQGITITVPTNFVLTNTVDNITVALSPDRPASDTLSGTLGSAGTRALNVGGSFSLPTAVTTGNYTGTFNVTVAYN